MRKRKTDLDLIAELLAAEERRKAAVLAELKSLLKRADLKVGTVGRELRRSRSQQITGDPL